MPAAGVEPACLGPQGTDEKQRQAKHRNTTVSVAGPNLREGTERAGCDTSRGSQSRAAIQRPMMRAFAPELAEANSRGERAPAARQRDRPSTREREGTEMSFVWLRTNLLVKG